MSRKGKDKQRKAALRAQRVDETGKPQFLKPDEEREREREFRRANVCGSCAGKARLGMDFYNCDQCTRVLFWVCNPTGQTLAYGWSGTVEPALRER